MNLDDIIELLVAEPWKREEVKTRLLAWAEAGKLEARLVELDLYEQFLNKLEGKEIERFDLYKFKTARLKDLTDRLAERRKLEGA